MNSVNTETTPSAHTASPHTASARIASARFASERFTRTRRRRTVVTLLAALCLFLAGTAAGAGLAVVYFRKHIIPASDGSERIGRLLKGSVMDGVTLSDEEKVAIDAAVKAGVDDVDKLNSEYGSMIQKRFGVLCQTICSILGQERAEQWGQCIRRDFGDGAAVMLHRKHDWETE